MPKIPFMIGSYNGRSTQWQSSRCVNLFPELAAAAKSEVALVGSPGMSLELNVENGTNPVFLILPIGDYLYAINKTHVTKVQYVDEAWGTQLSNAHGSTVDSLTTFAYDRNYLLLDTSVLINVASLACTPNLKFGWDEENDCQCVAYLDGYFIAVRKNSHQFYVSALTDPTSWDALDYASAETEADYLLRIVPFRKELWLFGELSTEVWYNSGDPDFPFARNPNAHINVGILNKNCVAIVGDTLMWIGKDSRGQGEVYIANGYEAAKISNPIIEYHLQSYADDYENASCWSFKMSGHDFFVMNFPAHGTWVFDLTTEEWHEWLQWDGDAFQPIKTRSYCFYAGKHLVSSRSNTTTNGIGSLSLDTYTMWGSPIKRVKRSPVLHDDRRRIFHNKFEADIHFENAGTIAMRYSDDGGYSWSNEKSITLGANERNRRVRWYRLGYSRGRIYELATESTMRTLWIDAFIELREGTH